MATIVQSLIGINDLSKLDEHHFAPFVRPLILRKKAAAAGVTSEVIEVKEIIMT